MNRPRLAPLALSPRRVSRPLTAPDLLPEPCHDGACTAVVRRTGPVRYPSLCRPGVAARGRLPEWPKGAVCKTVGSAYVGSNPTPATTCGNSPWPAWMRSGVDLVRVQCRPAGSGRFRLFVVE